MVVLIFILYLIAIAFRNKFCHDESFQFFFFFWLDCILLYKVKKEYLFYNFGRCFSNYIKVKNLLTVNRIHLLEEAVSPFNLIQFPC